MQLMVDSACAITAELIAAVTGQCGQIGAWGRYLSDGHGAAVPLSAAEVALAAEQVLPLLVYANNATGTSVAGRGVTDAWEAIDQAKQLGVPAGTMLCWDLEYGWPVAQAWIQDVIYAAGETGYVAGLYGALAQPYFRLPYADALRSGYSAQLVSASWSASGAEFASGQLPAWAPQIATPESAAMVVAWQACRYGTIGGGGPVDLGVWRGPDQLLWRPAPAPTTIAAPATGETTAATASPTATTAVATGHVTLDAPSAVADAFSALQTALRSAGLIP